MAEIDVFGWKYYIVIDSEWVHADQFIGAPPETIGLQNANHPNSNGKKRWIRKMDWYWDGMWRQRWVYWNCECEWRHA